MSDLTDRLKMAEKTSEIVHGWRRKPKGRWRRIASGSKEVVAAEMETFAQKHPSYCDSYTGQKDPNIPILRK